MNLPALNKALVKSSRKFNSKQTVRFLLLYPVKIVLAGPMLPLLNLPDPPLPFLVIGFAIYWTSLARFIHYPIAWIKGLNHRENY